jgi:hypothetical protein
MQLCGGKTKEGVFVGVLLSMSSTAVVSISSNILIYTCSICCWTPEYNMFGVLYHLQLQ